VTDALLTVNDLKASYGQVPVLHGLDFEVNESEIVVLLGANGAGKTTTLRALCGMVDTKGSVTVDGVECVGKPTEWIVRSVVVFPAPFAPISVTISPFSTSRLTPCSAAIAP